MKSFFEKLKDVLYDCMDYIIMTLIIIGVILIINWRLGGLFARDAIGELPLEIPNNTIQDKSTSNHISKPDNGIIEENNIDEGDREEDNRAKDDEEYEDIVIKLDIPPGSSSTSIAKILFSNDLIEDEDDFINRTVELGMDTKLKFGEFKIPKDSSYDEILNIITK